jgi:hypothetical protein
MDRRRISEFTADLDRVEEGIAVLVAPSGFQWHLPSSNLPPGATEGMALKVTLEIDSESTAQRLERIRLLREGLLGS